jgi:hypothetical protein
MRLWMAIFGAALLMGAASRPATAGPPIDWDPAYFYAAGATATSIPLGTELKAVGIISGFDVPFGDLNAGDPTREYTFVLYGLISQGTTSTGPPATTFYSTTFTGGTIEIYEDLSPESSFTPNPPNTAVPSSFSDGTLILSGSFTSFLTQTNNFTAFQVGNAEGNINWTGGTLLARTNRNGEPCPGLLTGGMTWRPDVLIAGYLFRHDGKIDLNCPTAAQSSTWGRLKSLYR